MSVTGFRRVDAATIRISAHRWPDEPTAWPRCGDATAIVSWLRAMWSTGGLADAIWAGSPQLASRVEAACSGAEQDVDRLWRVALSVARYVVRAQRRSTPFGLFSGVSALRFGTAVAVSSAGVVATRVRPDAAWLASLVQRLEADPEVRRRLRVQSNSLAVVQGGRVVVLRRPHASVQAESSCSVRYTPAVQLALSSAAAPMAWSDLVDTIAAAFPRSPDKSVQMLVADLVYHGVLVSNLRPPSTCTDPIGHLLSHLDGYEADDRHSQRPIPLRSLAAKGEARVVRPAELRSLAEQMHGLNSIDQPLAVDLRVADRVTLPEQVAADVVVAAEVLRRLTPDPTGRPQWRAYRSRFVDRYGMAAVVPVAEVVDAVTGLGYPAHFHAPTDQAAPSVSARDERLLALAQQASIDGVREVVLDDAAVLALAGADGHGHRVSAHVDVSAEIRAASLDAITAGRYTVAVAGMGRSALATSGRFLDLLPTADQERMVREFVGLPVAVQGAMPAQVSFPPHNLRSQNVLRGRQVLPWLISVGEYRPPAVGAIGVDDLGVAAGVDRLVLVSMSRRRVVEPTVAHAAAVHTMPLIARFLVELPRATDARLTPFTWGTAACLPFLPALRYGRILLTPARWRLEPGSLPDMQVAEAEWSAALDALRQRLGLPRWVHIGHGDQRLRLNLDHAMDRALLRAHLHSRPGAVTVVEAAGRDDFGWLSGRAHEVVVPVASTVAPAPPPAAVVARSTWPPPAPAQPMIPGSCGLVSASLTGDPFMMDTLLTRELASLLAEWDEPPSWWFVRLRHPVPHLRLRLHTDDYGDAVEGAGGIAEPDLRSTGDAGGS
ncbi:lantibiotic dehydratase family protein [Asanoa siamensis]|uniref:Uncharacterized protein n=1 Tax=Asanoa siamensis TaxID=926357 RepID=A0ABQ4CXG4_9ACTN|nr:lantibiotic dehydratase family protein [Asanoa siamensis]GIF75970.1 hypothetical protein Asi02nite_54880 [Asanoa siamensis]